MEGRAREAVIMETPRTQMKREVRERRLLYFGGQQSQVQSQPRPPHHQTHAARETNLPCHSPTMNPSASNCSVSACLPVESKTEPRASSPLKTSVHSLSLPQALLGSVCDSTDNQAPADESTMLDSERALNILRSDEDHMLSDIEDDISDMLSTHRPDFDSSPTGFDLALRQSIAHAVRESLEVRKPNFIVASNLEQLLGSHKYDRLLRNLEDADEEITARVTARESCQSYTFEGEKVTGSTCEKKPNPIIHEASLHVSSSLDSNTKHDARDVRCAFSADEIYAEAKRISSQAAKNDGQIWDRCNPLIGKETIESSFSSKADPSATSPTKIVSFSGNSSRDETLAPQTSHHCPTPSVLQMRKNPYGPIPKSEVNCTKTVVSSVDSNGLSISMMDSKDLQLASKGKIPKFSHVPSMSFGDLSVIDSSIVEEKGESGEKGDGEEVMQTGNSASFSEGENCPEQVSLLQSESEDDQDDNPLPVDQDSKWIESRPHSSLSRESLMQHVDEVQSELRKSYNSSTDDDLFSRVTSVVSAGEINEKLKKYGITFDFLKADKTFKEFNKEAEEVLGRREHVPPSLPRPGGGATPRRTRKSSATSVVKVCPECAEVASIYDTACADCGLSLEEVRPVPSKTPLEKSMSVDLHTVTDSTEFVYEDKQISGLSEGMKQQLSLNLRDSSDSKPGVSCPEKNLTDDFNFEYMQEKSVNGNYLSGVLQSELSLNLRSSNSSINTERHDAAVQADDLRLEDHATNGAEESKGDVKINEGEKCQDIAEAEEDFVKHLIVDPRFRPQSASDAKQSQSLPKKSKSLKRPKSAQYKHVTSRLFSSASPDNYQRRWASSVTCSVSYDPSTNGNRNLRPKSAKFGRELRPVSAGQRPKSAGFSRALQSLSHEDLTQIEAGLETNPARSLRVSQASPPLTSSHLPEPPSKGSESTSLIITGGDGLLKLPAANSHYAKYFALSPRVRAGDVSFMQCLPDEIVLFIFSFLSAADLGRCAVVCKSFNRVSMDCSLWHSVILRKRMVKDEWLTEIGKRRPSRISMIQCRGDSVSAQGLRDLFRECTECLKELNITGCHKGELNGNNLLLHAARCRYISHLDTSWCSLSDSALLSIVEVCESLESVCINGCQAITDEAMKSLVRKHGANLHTLEMFGCFSITDRAVTDIGLHCKGLITLNLGQCWKLSDTSLAQLSASLGCVENLDLRGCKQVKDATVHQILLNCPRLSSLALANIPDLTDATLTSIATLNPCISSLDLCGCTGLTNNGIKVLAQANQSLKYLDISSSKVTNQGISAMANYSNLHLEVIKLNFCKSISPACLKKLVQNCKRLKKLYLYGVNGVRAHVLEELRFLNPHLWIEM